MKKVAALLLLVLVFALASCSKKADGEKTAPAVSQKSSVTLSGDYVCSKHWNEDFVGELKMTFKDDKVSMMGVTNGDYTVKGDSLIIDLGSTKMKFKIDGNTLSMKGRLGEVAYTKQ